MRSPPEPSLLQDEQSQLPQPLLIGEVLQPSDHLSDPPLDPLQELHVLPVLGCSTPDGASQDLSRVGNHLPLPTGHPFYNAAQSTVGLPGCKQTLLAHVQLLVYKDPQVLLRRAALKEIFPRFV